MYPVLEPSFWKQRIAEARKKHHIVYVTKDDDWKYLNAEHKKILAKEVLPTDKVLDAGCGYGRSSELFTPEQYTGVDISPDLIAMAQEAYPNYRFFVGDLISLPFKDKEFDVVFCVSIKEMVQDNCGNEAWEPMEKELQRVAKKVLILEYTTPEKYFIL